MTIQEKCDLYYSISGETFTPDERNQDNIEHIRTQLNIYTKEDGSGIELSVPDPIKKGRFFSSDCYCLFINEAGQVLKIGSDNLFQIKMMRDGSDYERLRIKFIQLQFKGKIEWAIP